MILLSYSGGKDSTAMLLYAIELGVNFVAAYQDTAFDSPLHYEYLDYVQEKTGVEILRIKSRKYDGLVDMIEKKQAIPNRATRFCTENLKTDAVKELIRSRSDITENWVGMRAQESDARTKNYGDLAFDDVFPLSDFPQFSKREFGNIGCRLPIVDWSIDQVWDIHKKHGLKRNPLYDLGDKRVGCYPCVISSEKAWYSVWQTEHGKANIKKLDELERWVNSLKPEQGGMLTFRQGYKNVSNLIWQFEQMDKQLGLFELEDSDGPKCSWCTE